MNTFFLDNFINERELNHLAKEVKRRQLNKAICAIEKFNTMQTEVIKKQGIDASQYLQRKLSNKNAKRYF